VSTLVVVVGEISLEVAFECCVSRHQSASEGRPPALLQDGAMDSLHGAVGLGSASTNEALLGTYTGD
jgi:hypothetical protein